MIELPERIDSEEMLDKLISEPGEDLIELCGRWKGTTAILGIGGKMGFHLGMMLTEATRQSGGNGEVIGISRFSDSEVREKIESSGVRTFPADLMNPESLDRLPDVDRVMYMVGRKFGTSGSEDLTWAVNTLVPAAVCRRYAGVPTVAYSTGAVYDRVPVNGGGAIESYPLTPLGEYANAAVGRERIFSYMSEETQTPICLIRLFYSIDLRYGVLRDIGDKVAADEVVDLSMGHVNVIWQGDAINQSLLAFSYCGIPAQALNVTGEETVSVRYIAEKFGEILGRDPKFSGVPASDALLGNTAKAVKLFGKPRVSVDRMIAWTANWISAGGSSLNKPTHFEVRNGNY
jgi:nucleoside-diphosphate-sugar epimerase